MDSKTGSGQVLQAPTMTEVIERLDIKPKPAVSGGVKLSSILGDEGMREIDGHMVACKMGESVFFASATEMVHRDTEIFRADVEDQKGAIIVLPIVKAG